MLSRQCRLVTLCYTLKRLGDARLEMQRFAVINEVLYTVSCICPYHILLTGPRNLTWFGVLLLGGRHGLGMGLWLTKSPYIHMS